MKTITTISMALLLGAPAFAQKVSVEYAHRVDFSKVHTYRWGKNKGQLTDPAEDAHIKRALDRALQAKGLQRVDTRNSDVVLTYQATMKSEQQVDSYADDDDLGLGPGWGWGPGWGLGWGDLDEDEDAANTVVTVHKGDLLVDMADPANKRMLFRGYSTGAFHSDPVKEDQLMSRTIDKMFKNFPPKKK